ncbi:uncharacterized protein BKCO1_7000157 [Diplodia corticola]|uniref:Duf521 domain protein n=1 Tax=Diplodia corticola TaxID=236234 RepID=A0A1J9R797_9PEZI|nr:uncharacterized protein BKCO1_7000157 [Diplodia corticola]OJD37398.1 hypothetical protein BKCO1_7000157 [Diplodia corticola]
MGDVAAEDAPQPKEFTVHGTAYVSGSASGEVLASHKELSFWGGVDPLTGEVIDRHHPLSGSCLKDKVLVIPGGRGSCSGSGVMLELLLNGTGPSAVLFERREDILTLGVVVADELFAKSIPVVTLGSKHFRELLSARHLYIHDNRVSVTDHSSTRAEGWHADDTAAKRASFASIVSLSPADHAFLSGSRGPAARTAMRIIVRMAALQGASELLDVTQVHIDGCVYTGPASLAFASRLRDAGGRVVVPTTLNSISVDQRRWRHEHGVDAVALGEPSERLAAAYTDMGAAPTFTCAPYNLGTAPRRGEQVAWAESNAVVYANSVLGARTMKYPDFLDLAVALTGRAPCAGPHVESNRLATVCIRLPNALLHVDDSFYPALGYCVGGVAANRIPVILGLAEDGHLPPSTDDLKAFGAAFATLSSAPMFHMVGVTPEAATLEDAVGGEGNDVPVVDLDMKDLACAWDTLNSADRNARRPIDLVSLGNPHFSLSEIRKLAALCRGRRKDGRVAVIVTCGRSTHGLATQAGLVAELEAFGVQFVTDTCWCMIREPIVPRPAKTIMTNSAKYAHYGPGLTGRRFCFGSLASCVEAACEGVHSVEHPRWLGSLA